MARSDRNFYLAFILILTHLGPKAAAADQCLEGNMIFEIPSEDRREFSLCAGETLLVSSKTPIDTVVLAEENIVSINAISAQMISMMPLQVGEANIQIFGGSKELMANMKVVVKDTFSNKDVNQYSIEASQANGSVDLVTKPDENRSTRILQGSNETTASSEIIINAGSAVISYECKDICEKNDR